ncbi:MAG: hypothetical protein KBT03_08015 [Bacteroidales bacterium]|nr:hypothetical protein [Candidatus Scybalousia scybalohippi]
MGTIRNRMTIVHGWEYEKIREVRNNAISSFQTLFGNDYDVEKYMVSQLLESPINGEFSFVIMGDCSKNGWDKSEELKEFRMKWAKSQLKYVQNIVIVDLGEGDDSFLEDVHDELY